MSENKNIPAWKQHMSSRSGGTFVRSRFFFSVLTLPKTPTGKKPNPIYFTNNSVYGSKKGGAIHKATTKFNRKGEFTKHFCGAAQNTALNTTTTKSKVHKSFDCGFDS